MSKQQKRPTRAEKIAKGGGKKETKWERQRRERIERVERNEQDKG